MLKTSLFVMLFSIPQFVSAQVVINEVAWMGTPVDGVDQKQWWRYEWIELHNPTDNSVSIHGWIVELWQEEVDSSVPLTGAIPPGGYFVVGASDKVPNIDKDYSNLSGKLRNSGQLVVLKDASGAVIDELDARQGWFAGDNDIKVTMERWDPTKETQDSGNWSSSMDIGGTPGTQNSIFGKEMSEIRPMIAGEAGPVEFLGKKQKDPLGSSRLDLLNLTTGTAILAALVSLLLVLLLKRLLVAPLSFQRHEEE